MFNTLSCLLPVIFLIIPVFPVLTFVFDLHRLPWNHPLTDRREQDLENGVKLNYPFKKE